MEEKKEPSIDNQDVLDIYESVSKDESREKQKKVSRKVFIVSGISIVIILVAIIVATLLSGGKFTSSDKTIAVALSAYCDEDGVAYIPLMDGSIRKIDDDVSQAYITPDRKRIIVIKKDGTVYYTYSNAQEEVKVTVADNGQDIHCVEDEGLIYEDSEQEYHRYLFSDSSDVNLGALGLLDFLVSEQNFNIAFSDESGVYYLGENSQEKEKLANYDYDCSIFFVSDDGDLVYWIDYDGEMSIVYAYMNGEKTKIGTLESSYPHIIQNKIQKYAVIYDYESENMILVSEKEEPINVKLGNKLYDGRIYNQTGFFSEDSSSSFKGIYINILNDDSKNTFNIYYIDKQGEREKILSDVKYSAVYDGFLYYVDEDDNLKQSKISGMKLSEEKKITGDVEAPMYFCNKYFYFLKDISEKDSTGILYVYKPGSDPDKIDSEVLNGSTIISNDGKTIYYYKNVDTIDDISGIRKYGDLYRYTYGAKNSEKISSDVIIGTVESGIFGMNGNLPYSRINNKSFVYQKYSYVKKGKMISDWYYFDGAKSEIMASDIYD